MARTKTTSSKPEDHSSPKARTHSPPPNVAADQTSDQQPLNETPLHIVLPGVIIPAFDTPKLLNPNLLRNPSSNLDLTL